MGAAVLQEYKAIAELHRRYSYDFILSDNRFGCRVPGVRSAIMTHQVHLPIRNWFSRKLGNVLNHRFLSKFDQIIIPDEKLQPRLAGNMSAPHPKCPTTYIGPVSRFSIPPQQKSPTTSIALAIVLSGPEPQRTILEDLLLNQLTSTALSGIIILVRGRPKHAPAIPEGVLRQVESAGQQLEIHNFMKGAELERVLAKADIILTRPGYTTVMDLSVLRRKAIFTPTPGQPEQEWLGRSLHAAGLGICIEQSQLRLTEAIEKWKTINHQSERGASRKSSLLKEWVDQILTHTEP